MGDYILNVTKRSHLYLYPVKPCNNPLKTDMSNALPAIPHSANYMAVILQ